MGVVTLFLKLILLILFILEEAILIGPSPIFLKHWAVFFSSPNRSTSLDPLVAK
jgi:hypothetical protein